MSVSLKLSDFFSPSEFPSRAIGDRVRETILQHWGEDRIELDFEGYTIAYSGFLDSAVAGLFMDYPPKDITSKLIITNINEFDRQMLNQLCHKRIPKGS